MTGPRPTRRAFVAWLNGKADFQRVGTIGSPGWCPLALFLREVLDAPSPDVMEGEYKLDADSGRSWITRGWMVKIVETSDEMSPPPTGINSELAILAGPLREALSDQGFRFPRGRS